MSELERLRAEVDELRALLSTANYQRDTAIQQLAGLKMQIDRLRLGKKK